MTDPVLADLLAFLGDSPTPFHAVASATARLEAAGFRAIAETDDWSSLAPGRYAFAHGGSSLLAFVIPDGKRIAGFRIVGAHTDSPNLRLKPTPEYTKEGYAQLGVEVYGGALLNSWLDRDLSLAGRVFVAPEGATRKAATRTSSRLVRFTRPMLRVPQLAIHLDREVNDKGVVLNKQEHLAPIFGLERDGARSLATMLAEELGVAAERIVGSELMLYDVVAPTLGGRDEEMIFSARLDNLAMSPRRDPRARRRRAARRRRRARARRRALRSRGGRQRDAPTARSRASCRARSSASCSAAAARARTTTARSPARSACPPTWRTRFTRTTSRATSRGTSRSSTAAP